MQPTLPAVSWQTALATLIFLLTLPLAAAASILNGVRTGNGAFLAIGILLATAVSFLFGWIWRGLIAQAQQRQLQEATNAANTD